MDTDAVTIWLARLQAGDTEAVRPLWDRYFHRLVGLARSRLRAVPRLDGEDAALSAFDSFCRHAADGRFPDLTDRAGLWRLLAAFTLRKVAHHLRAAARLKRAGAAEPLDALHEALSREPDPALAAELVEECDRLLDRLGDPELRRIALLRLEGCSVEETAARMKCAPRTVKRRLHLVRVLWEREVGDD
jgi:DNA-directed RNA polymerase specialized sigma24 family protein